jgi:hypothetical protein
MVSARKLTSMDVTESALHDVIHVTVRNRNV